MKNRTQTATYLISCLYKKSFYNIFLTELNIMMRISARLPFVNNQNSYCLNTKKPSEKEGLAILNPYKGNDALDDVHRLNKVKANERNDQR